MRSYIYILFILSFLVACKKTTPGPSTYTFKVIDKESKQPVAGTKLVIFTIRSFSSSSVDTLGISDANGELTCPFEKVSPEYGRGSIEVMNSNYAFTPGISNDNIDFNKQELIQMVPFTTAGIILHRITPRSQCAPTGNFRLFLESYSSGQSNSYQYDAIACSDTTIFIKVSSKKVVTYYWSTIKIPDDCISNNYDIYYMSPTQNKDATSGYKDTTYVNIDF